MSKANEAATKPPPSGAPQSVQSASGESHRLADAAREGRRIAAVIGTAGHVDHGKTALVRALTGMETDRLPEEQARGISIELGFAWLDRPLGRVAIIDVPGHERFVRQMVAGATGIDAILLVVAADEGVMPQTREHLAICHLLGVRQGLVVMSRADLVEPDFLELAREDIAATVAGTFLENAPIVPFSIHDPLAPERLRVALDAVIAAVHRDDEGDRPFLLALDRSFSRPGFGTIVTGTSRSGAVAVGDEVIIYQPRSGPFFARVRGLELHGESVTRAAFGQRVAMNLAGVAATDLERGARICHTGLAAPAPGSMWDVEFEALAALPIAIPDNEKGLACFGATVVEASLGIVTSDASGGGGPAEVQPGERVLAQLRLSEPLALLPGERWIFRGFRDFPGVAATLGGGRVLAPSVRRRRRGAGVSELAAIAGSDVALALVAQVAAYGEAGVPWRRLHATLPFPQGAIDAAVAASTLIRSQLAASPSAAVAGDPDESAVLVSRLALDPLTDAIDRVLSAFHQASPTAAGLAPDEVRTRVRPNADPVVFRAILDALVSAGHLVANGGTLACTGFEPRVTALDDALDEAVLAHLTEAGMMPPRNDGLAVLLGASWAGARPVPTQASIDAAITRLVTRNKLVRVQKDMVFATITLSALEASVRSWFARNEWLDAQALKELTGATRKWSIPLGEWLDRARITVRVQDRRRLRG